MERLDLHEENDDYDDCEEKMDVSVLTPATGMRSTLKIQ